MFLPYPSAQAAADAWAILSAALESVGAVSYDPEDALEESSVEYDPSPLVEQRATLAAVFDAAQSRIVERDDGAVSWMVWVEYRLMAREDDELSVQEPERRICEVDAVVEAILDERGLLEPNYRQRAEDREPLGA